MKKRILSLLLVFVMIFSISSVVFADMHDLTNIVRTDGARNYKYEELLNLDSDAFEYVFEHIDQYIIEAGNGNKYYVSEVNNKLIFGAKTFKEAIQGLTPYVVEDQKAPTEDKQYGYDVLEIKREIFRLVNEFRLSEGRKPLDRLEILDPYSNLRAREINEHFSHTRPDGSDFDSGFFGAAGENIGKFSRATNLSEADIANTLFTGWYNSPGHRENMLHPDYTHISLGISIEISRDKEFLSRYPVVHGVQIFTLSDDVLIIEQSLIRPPGEGNGTGAEQAAKIAKTYLEQQPFSRQGLINFLVDYAGFILDEAEYGVDSIKADWCYQAARLAKKTIDSNPDTTRYDLKEQLVAAGFTPDEAEKGISSISVTWDEQAAKTAQRRLEQSPYSRQVLIDSLVQLDRFTLAEAINGVDFLDVDWNAQAAKTAQRRLEQSPYSRQVLIGNLVQIDRFATDEAENGVDSLNVNWDEQAAKMAQRRLEKSTYSRRGLIESLVQLDGFTHDEAEHGVDSINVDWSTQAAKITSFYLSYFPYPRQVLINHLVEIDGFTLEEATAGVDSINADWIEQAAKTAQNLLDSNPYSRQHLIDSLVDFGFTHDEAESGVDSINVDWKEQAARAAQKFSDYSREELIDVLMSRGFSLEEAEYAANSVIAEDTKAVDPTLLVGLFL